MFRETALDTYRTNPCIPSLSVNIRLPKQYRPGDVYRYLLV